MGTLMLQCLNILLIITLFSEVYCYDHYFIDTNKICSLNGKASTIKIGDDNKSGAIVEDSTYLSSLSGKYEFSCKFLVESSSSMGIFVVIQNMDLRKNKTSGECLDYVKFSHTSQLSLIPKKGNNKSYGTRLHCGHVNASEMDLQDIDPTNGNNLIPSSYIDPKGRITVEIYVAAVPILPIDKLSLKIAFTAFQVCRHNMGNYRWCGADGCIWHQYFKDGIVNCPFVSCIDEDGSCSIYYNDGRLKVPSTGLATKVLVGAVAGVCTMFIVFIAFLWVFRHCGFCWSNPTTPHRSASPMIPVSTNSHREIRPTAPSRSPSLDKDLPPSYESLFPSSNIS